MSPQILKLNVGGDMIGLRSVDEAFQYAWNRRLVGGKAADKLFEIVSQKNYIAEGCEQEYKVALLAAYERRFDIGKDDKQEAVLMGGNKGCCSSDEGKQEIVGCCGSNVDKRSLLIEFLYLDLNDCNWCQDTETNFDKAISETENILKAIGVDVTVKKTHVQSEQQAFELGFESSPTIRINGNDIQFDVKESYCESCSNLCGEDVACRIWIYQGKEYTAPPKGMIIDAIMREVYAGSKKNADTSSKTKGVPENLKKFFAAKQSKENGPLKEDHIRLGTPQVDSGSC